MSLNFDESNKAENIIANVINSKTKKKINNLCLYEDEEEGGNDIEIDNNYKFMLAPRPIKEKERSVLFIAGESGAGKSYFVREYAKEYKKMFSNNPIYLISYLDRDETLDSYKEITRLNCFNDQFLNDAPDLNLETEFSNSLVIFDDVDSITEKKIKTIIYGLLNKMLRIGRHYNLSVAYLGHELYASHELKGILNESHSITFFPKFLNYKKLKYLLEEYFGLNKEQVQKIRTIKDRNVTYIKGADKVIVSDTKAFIL
jgi:hypothetical protein